MCGICGIVDYSRNPIDGKKIALMRDIMLRRGPDSADTKIFPYAALGHRRLAIIDLSTSGNQPMTNEKGDLWLVLNGEIYNYRELRDELIKAGHCFRSNTDTEVLLHGFEEWGMEALLKRINGMFAFALWDMVHNKLYGARDRLGKKPLYYSVLNNKFFFASDIKSVLSGLGHDVSVSSDSIAKFLYWGYIPGPETIFSEIKHLPPGSWFRFSQDGLRTQRYWSISFSKKTRMTFPEAIEAVDHEIKQAVKRRLYSDVPLGVFLSGGVDSSLITFYMSQLNDSQIRSFSVGFNESAHDERDYAREVAAHCHTKHTEYLGQANSMNILPLLVGEFGQPFGDAAAIPTYLIAQAVRRDVTVALTGDGGDESFAGYSHHQGRYLGGMLSWLMPDNFIKFLVNQTFGAYDTGRDGFMPSAKRFLRYCSNDPFFSFSSPNYWDMEQLGFLCSNQMDAEFDHESILSPAIHALKSFDGDSLIDRALHLDFAMLLPYDYNIKVDVATMANSLEARSPFIDYKVVELAASIQPTFKVKLWERKYLLKQLAARYLPREIIFRPKHGFSVPINEWMRREWVPMAKEILFGKQAKERGLFDLNYIEQCFQEHLTRKKQHGFRLWLLVCLELWFQVVLEQTVKPNEFIANH